jgi:REP element-mobilizing transposase RayT
MTNPRHPFEADTIYHVYNHGNGNDLIFREPENYRYFLERFNVYITPVARLYAYCLMPNHFHFLIRLKSKEELVGFFKVKYPGKMRTSIRESSEKSPINRDRSTIHNIEEDFADLSEITSELISMQFKNFLISYSKSFNKMYERRGSLFLDNIKRIPVLDDDYFANMIRYIHFNPVIHGFTDNVYQWKFNSIHTYLSDKPSIISRQDVIDWFGGTEAFKKFHQSIQENEFDVIKHLTLE